MNRRDAIVTIPGLLILGTYPAAAQKFDIGGAIGAAKDATKAATLTDSDVRNYAAQMAAYSDRQARIAPGGDKYAQRLVALPTTSCAT